MTVFSALRTLVHCAAINRSPANVSNAAIVPARALCRELTARFKPRCRLLHHVLQSAGPEPRFFHPANASALSQPDHNVDRCDFSTGGGIGHARDNQLVGGRIAQPAFVFPVEMRVVMHVGVKIAF